MKDANDFLATLEKLIKSPDAYKLSDTQYDDLTRLRDDAMTELDVIVHGDRTREQFRPLVLTGWGAGCLRHRCNIAV